VINSTTASQKQLQALNHETVRSLCLTIKHPKSKH